MYDAVGGSISEQERTTRIGESRVVSYAQPLFALEA